MKLDTTTYDFVFLELGYQVLNEHVSVSTFRNSCSGSGRHHIIAKHEPDFVNIGVRRIFQHLQNWLLYGQRAKHKKLNYYFLRMNGQILSTVMYIGTNGYFSAACPCSKLNLDALDSSDLIELPSPGDADANDEDEDQESKGSEDGLKAYATFGDETKIASFFITLK